MKKFVVLLFSVIFLFFTGSAIADSIDPLSFSDTLAVGESVTIRKTVTVTEEAPTEGILDVMFLIDTSGSMGDEIDAAKAAASDILSGLAGFGDLASGVGYYSEPDSMGVYHDLTTDTTTGIADINSITLGLGGYGGDFPEEGINGVYEAATEASWRPGSTRFIIALGDANFKESDGTTLAMAQTALSDSGATFIGIDYGFTEESGYYQPVGTWVGMTTDVPVYFESTAGISADELGSVSAASGLSTDDLVDDIISGVTASFEEYSTVSVSDLGAGLPGVGVSVAAVGAGAVGDSFVGAYDRSIERTFEFDVTFTGLAEGTHDFTTLALVDGGAVATEEDSITVGGGAPVPEPATMVLFGLGLLGLAGISRKKS